MASEEHLSYRVCFGALQKDAPNRPSRVSFCGCSFLTLLLLRGNTDVQSVPLVRPHSGGHLFLTDTVFMYWNSISNINKMPQTEGSWELVIPTVSAGGELIVWSSLWSLISSF